MTEYTYSVTVNDYGVFKDIEEMVDKFLYRLRSEHPETVRLVVGPDESVKKRRLDVTN